MGKSRLTATNSSKILLMFFLVAMFLFALVKFAAPFVKGFLIVERPLRYADTLVVMAGSQSERLPAAADVFKKRLASKILLANDGVSAAFSTVYNRNLYQVEWAEEELVELGVPRENIVKLPFYGSGTMFDVLAAKKHMLDHNLKSMILVTSDYHTRRSLWAFSHALKGYAIEVSIYSVKSDNVDTRGILVEYVKNVYYILKYGLMGLLPEMKEVPFGKK